MAALVARSAPGLPPDGSIRAPGTGLDAGIARGETGGAGGAAGAPGRAHRRLKEPKGCSRLPFGVSEWLAHVFKKKSGTPRGNGARWCLLVFPTTVGSPLKKLEQKGYK